MVVVPFQPTALTNDPAVTSDTVIRFTWTASVNGGTDVLYYSVYTDHGFGSGSYFLL